MYDCFLCAKLDTLYTFSQTFKIMAGVDSVVPILQMKKQRLREAGWAHQGGADSEWQAGVWTRWPPVLLPVPFPPHLSTLCHLKTKLSLWIHNQAVLFQWYRKHVSANKTFILCVNRLLNKVNITVIEGKTHPSKCPQRPCAYDARTTGWKERKLHGIQLFCDAKHMGREGGVQTVPETVCTEGFQAGCWDPIHLQGLEPDNLWSYSNSLRCGSLLFTGGLQSWAANWECNKEKHREGLKSSAMYQLALGGGC